MSNFQAQAIHPITGELELADWLDNYFGHHRYGVRFASGKVYTEDQVAEAGLQSLVEEAEELGMYE